MSPEGNTTSIEETNSVSAGLEILKPRNSLPCPFPSGFLTKILYVQCEMFNVIHYVTILQKGVLVLCVITDDRKLKSISGVLSDSTTIIPSFVKSVSLFEVEMGTQTDRKEGTHTHTHAHSNTHTHIHTLTYTHTHTHTHTHTYTHTFTHSHTHTHTLTLTQSSVTSTDCYCNI